jgi:hypothetical protein
MLRKDECLQQLETAIVGFTEMGAQNGCPFCIGRMIDEVEIGDRITFLKGNWVGRTAEVVALTQVGPGTFQVRFSNDPPGHTSICSYGSNQFLRFPLPPVPSWLCSLSVEDLISIEDAILYNIRCAIIEGRAISCERLARAVVTVVWYRRLPVSGERVFATLAAHGVSDELRKEFALLFDFGVDLLITAHGRPPIKRKQVSPMSIGKYISDGSRRFHVAHFGYAPTTSLFRE